MTTAQHTAIMLAASIGRRLADRLTVTDEDGEIEHTCTLGAMVADNLHDADTVTDVLGLKPGGSVEIGGGGAAYSRITRAA